MRQVVLLPGVMAVVGSQERRPQAMGDLDKLRVGLALLLQPVVLQLDEQVVPPEDVLEPCGTRSGELHVTAQQGLVDEAPEAPGRRDNPLVVALEQLPVRPRLVPVPCEVGLRGQLEQVLVPAVVLRQQRQVVIELVALICLPAGVVEPAPSQWPLQAALARHVGLDADDRLDTSFPGRLVEVQDPVHVAVVCDGDGRLAVGDGPFDDLVDPCRAVEHRELRVEVQMGKRCAHSPTTSLRSAPLRALSTGVCGQPVDE